MVPEPDNIDTDVVVDTDDELIEEGASKEETGAQTDFFAALMADPDIQAVLSAKRSGKTIKISSEDSVEDQVAAVEKQTYDNMPEETKQLLDILEAKLSPLTKDIEGLKSMASGYEKSQVDNQISNIEKKHSDFAKYRKSMGKIARSTQGLGVEELYYLAKFRSGDLKLDMPSTESERPTTTPRRFRIPEKSEIRRGRRGFGEIMADALEKFDN